MVNVAARCRLCDDPPPPCRLAAASSYSTARLRTKSKRKTQLIRYNNNLSHAPRVYILFLRNDIHITLMLNDCAL